MTRHIRMGAALTLGLMTGCPILSGPDHCLPDEPPTQCCKNFPDDPLCPQGDTESTGTTDEPAPGNPTDDGGSTTADPHEPVCGNKIVEKGEQCDDGNEVESDQCDSCTATLCGNGITDNGEECDDGNPNTYDACTNVCKRARCGDGIIQEGVEQCDDGNLVDNDLCNNECMTTDFDPFPPQSPKRCGDGYCDPKLGETLETCDIDCSVCGDGLCTGLENNSSCLIDCGCEVDQDCQPGEICQADGSCTPTSPG